MSEFILNSYLLIFNQLPLSISSFVYDYLALILIAGFLVIISLIYFFYRRCLSHRTEIDQFHASVLDNIQDAVYRTDMDGKVVWYSRSALDILKYKPVNGKVNVNVADYYAYPEEREKFLAELKMNGSVSNYELCLKRGDGQLIYVSLNAKFWRDKNGEIIGTEGVFRDITNLKQTKEALVDAEARFRESLKYSQAILYRLNLKTNTYDYMSDAVYNITGFTPEEVINMGADGVNALVHPHDRKYQIDYRYKLIDVDKGNQEIYYTESRIKGKNGKYIWSGDSHALIRGTDGEPLYIIGCARDITEFKQIEQSLRQSELLTRKTLDSIDEAIHVVDSDMKVILMNKTFLNWCDELGLGTDYEGKSIFELFPFLPEKVPDEYRQVMSAGESLITDEEFHFGGRTIITETRKIPVTDNGVITRIVTIIRDITLQRQAEAARIESEARFHEALENSHDILYRLNLRTNRYDYMSSSVFKITGYTRDEVLAVEADGINSITHPDDLKITENYRTRLIEAGSDEKTAHTIEYRIQHKDGFYIWLGDVHTLIRDSNGEPLYIMGTARDITEQKLTEIRHKARINLLDNLRRANDIDTCLNYGCQAIFEADLFERSVLTLHNSKKEIINIGYFGLDEKTIIAARNAPPPDDKFLAQLTQPQYRISNSYFIPAEADILIYNTDRIVAQEDFTDSKYSTWQPRDELFVPIKGNAKNYDGWLSVDTPFDRRRPDLDVITLLEETVDIVTQKVREIRYFEKSQEKNRELRESEKKYRNLIDSNPDPISLYQNKKTVMINPAFTGLFGYTLEDLNGENGFLIMMDKKNQKLALNRMKDRRNGKPLTKTFRIKLISKDGKTIPCETSLSKIQFQGQEADFISIRDISDRIKVMEALKNSEEFNRAVIEYSPIGVSVRSRTGKLLSYNQTWRDIWALTDDEINDYKARPRNELKFDDRDSYLGNWLPKLEKIYREGGYLYASDIHITNHKVKGEFWISQHFYAIKNENDEVDRVVILTEDITKRKMAEDKIKIINNEKLEQAKHIAGTFAHEIRNALFPAVASLNKLKRSSRVGEIKSEYVDKYAGIAERSVIRAADLTRLISDYSKLDTENMPETVNLSGVIDEILKNNLIRIKDERVDINITGEKTFSVRSNRKQLLLALNNLLLNSLDAMTEDRKPRIDIDWNLNRDYLVLTFADNGKGVASDDIEKIFEPFFSMKSEIGGTGLGLAVTKRIIEMYGGLISVQSKTGQGTKFKIKLKYINPAGSNSLKKTE